MYSDMDGNTHALNRHQAEMDQHDAEEARFEVELAGIVDDLIVSGSRGDFELSDIMYSIVEDDEDGDIADLLTAFMLSNGESKLLGIYITQKVEEKVREGTNAK